jgi:hypothetical protein
MIPYQYIAVALLSTVLNVSQKMDIVANNQCYYEEYRSCFIPDHCIYYDKYYDFSPIIGFDYVNLKIRAYYDIADNYYMLASPPRLVPSTNPTIQYVKHLEITSSSVPLYNTSYVYFKDFSNYKEYVNGDELVGDLLEEG